MRPKTIPGRDPADRHAGSRPVPGVIEDPAGGYIAFGRNRWLLWQTAEGRRARVLIDTSRPRIVIVGVAVVTDSDQTPDATVRASDLRKIPLGRLESFLNGRDTARNVRAALDSGVTHLKFDFSPNEATINDEVRQIERRKEPTAEYRIRGAHLHSNRPEDFYLNVAAAWTRALAEGHTNPAKVLAGPNNVPATQVHSWVKQARRKGLLPPSSRATNASES